jgi:hypothetical protein
MKLTFISTPGHGYLIVPKKLIRKLGYPYQEISKCSGHDLKNVYLEEDCDATKFCDYLEDAGIEVQVKSIYREYFSIAGNFVPGYFNSALLPGEWIALDNGMPAKVVYWQRSKIVVRDINGSLWSLPTSNPFRYLCNSEKSLSCM